MSDARAGPPRIEDYVSAAPHPQRQAGGKRPPVAPPPGQPLVSIVTIVRNRKATLARTMAAVVAQTYPYIEYIVVDGVSTDGTLEVIRAHEEHISRWVSEPDRSSSDAMNKAISLTRGDYFFWLSADDWVEPPFIESAVETLLRSGADFVYGDVHNYEGDTFAWAVKGGAYPDSIVPLASAQVILNPPSMVIRRACFERIGLFDLGYRVANDYDWIVRLHLAGGRGVYDPRLVSHFSLGGVSSGGDFTPMLENLRVLRSHGLLKGVVALRQCALLIRFTIGQILAALLPGETYARIKRNRQRRKRATR